MQGGKHVYKTGPICCFLGELNTLSMVWDSTVTYYGDIADLIKWCKFCTHRQNKIRFKQYCIIKIYLNVYALIIKKPPVHMIMKSALRRCVCQLISILTVDNNLNVFACES